MDVCEPDLPVAECVAALGREWLVKVANAYLTSKVGLEVRDALGQRCELLKRRLQHTTLLETCAPHT